MGRFKIEFCARREILPFLAIEKGSGTVAGGGDRLPSGWAVFSGEGFWRLGFEFGCG